MLTSVTYDISEESRTINIVKWNPSGKPQNGTTWCLEVRRKIRAIVFCDEKGWTTVNSDCCIETLRRGCFSSARWSHKKNLKSIALPLQCQASHKCAPIRTLKNMDGDDYCTHPAVLTSHLETRPAGTPLHGSQRTAEHHTMYDKWLQNNITWITNGCRTS